MNIDGVLPVMKPAGYTSHDVVAKTRRILRMKRIGHTGTLDPQVTGVLPLCLGKATKLVEYIQELPKEYEAVLRIGVATDTEDATGEILETAEHIELTSEVVERTIQSFVGSISQVPPMYSAIKVGGKRLYELAREGQVVERKAREVTIYSIEIINLDLDKPFPEVRFRALCSKGTYIRTLCVDIGRSLGYPATMAELIRTSTGNITMDQSYTLEEIEAAQVAGTLQQLLIPMEEAVAHMIRADIKPHKLLQALQGQKLQTNDVSPFKAREGDILAAFTDAGKLAGFYRYEETEGRLVPVKIFSEQD
ncbi:pseudouridine synthase [Paenibacillus swuensis]|uniref:tRNA pseudouridine synthase B n=1 Tax=Paenibacillus swuensis TaxID=1178515 RepID=A0A172TKM7_9BACL|nr:tRNA pseudouridine(55) synthase TruB [Paenibacillus swuensis]ANE47580.1 pseudouridine synthase [Paenibacillus swuensis]